MRRREFLEGGVAGLWAASQRSLLSLASSQNPSGDTARAVNEDGQARSFGPVTVDYPGLLSSHDVVYLSPPVEGFEGLTLGEGEAGAMLWNPPDRLSIQINHSSLWDDEPSEAKKEERKGVLRYAAGLEIFPGIPLFEWKYLADYEAWLNLFQAETTFRARGALGEVTASAIYSHPHKVFMLDYRDETGVAGVRKVVLNRFGSRSFGRWYSTVVQEPEIGLAGTAAKAEGQEFWIEQSFTNLSFVVVARIVPQGDEFQSAAVNPYQVEAVAPAAAKRCAFRLFLAVVHSGETGNPLETARKRLDLAIADGQAKLREVHRADWAAQWARSFVHLSANPYAENLWYLTLYQNIASRRGQEPPFFINSIWSWTGDVRAWASAYLHWNMFIPNLPLFSSGHADLMEPYFRWKERQLPYAQDYARQVFRVAGACFTDYASWHGEQTNVGASIKYNLTPGPQIAMEFYRYWQYTQDSDFLRNPALIFLRSVATFYLSYVEKDDRGVYHVPRSRPYEFGANYEFRDCLTDLSYIRWLLPALIDAERQASQVTELSARARDVLEHLAPIESSPIHPFWLAAEVSERQSFNPNVPLHYTNPFFEGEIHSENDRVYSLGFSLKDAKVVSHMDVIIQQDTAWGSVMDSVQFAPVYPCGLVNVDASPEQRGDKAMSAHDIQMWEMGRNGIRTMRKVPSSSTLLIPGGEDFRPDWKSTPNLTWTGHSLELPALARLGLARNLEKALDFFIQEFQMFPQGLWCYWGWRHWTSFVQHPKGSRTGKPVFFPDNPRMLHASLEPGGIFAQAINEMLLCDYDGVIRLFPACREDAAFRLSAVGGFNVTSRQVNGEVLFVYLESPAGGTCAVSNPWHGREVLIVEEARGASLSYERRNDRIQFKTEQGKTYLLTPQEGQVTQWTLTDSPRREPRFYGRTSLGKPRDF